MPSPILETHGPILIGVFVKILLYGMLFVQAMTYFETFTSDKRWMKCYVALLLLADTLHTFLTASFIFYLMISNFGNIEAYTQANWLLSSDPALGAIIIVSCQAFFCWRIFVLTKNYYISGFVTLLSVVILVGGLGIGIILKIHPDLTNLEKFQAWVYLWLLPGVIADITISSTLTFFLLKRDRGFRTTDSVIRKIVRMAVQNCLLTTLLAIAVIILYRAKKNKGYHIGLTFIIPLLYSNAVLTSLNHRRHFNKSSGYSNSSGVESGGANVPYGITPGGNRVAARLAVGSKTGGMENGEIIRLEETGPHRDKSYFIFPTNQAGASPV